MSCFSCFSSEEKRSSERFDSKREQPPVTRKSTEIAIKQENAKVRNTDETTRNEVGTKRVAGNGNIVAQTFTFHELVSATKNFRSDYFIGERGFGRVYKGRLENTGQIVAVKQLDRNGMQGNREFLVEVLMLSLLHHQNLVNLIGYCADGEQRLLVYEHMAMGSLEDHLLDVPPDQKPLSWHARMKIAFGAAKGLEYLHDKANPPVIYRDLKPSNILLDQDFSPKLFDFGLAKFGPVGEDVYVPSKVMGTYGYCAPEYLRTGQLTVKTDVYSFGVVMLELITGRRALDTLRLIHEQTLASWAQPMLKDQKRYTELVDPRLRGEYPTRALNQAVAVAAMCLHEEDSERPLMADIVVALDFLVTTPAKVEERSSPSFRPALISEMAFGDPPKPDEGSDLERRRAVEQAVQWGSRNSEASGVQPAPAHR